MSKYFSEIKSQKRINKMDFSDGSVFKFIESFSILSMDSGETFNFETGLNETGLLVMEGHCDIVINGKEYRNIGSRQNTFIGLPTGVYIPINRKVEITSHGSNIAVCSGRCDKKTEFAIIKPEDVKIMEVGKDNWQREVRIIIGPNSPSVNLILGETINPPGNWSGTPAHKHEINSPSHESLHEELYYFRVDKPQGFGVQRFYSPERGINELIYLKEGTVTFMPWGYHQIVAGPGYTLYYLFFISGKGKDLIGNLDPEHRWINK